MPFCKLCHLKIDSGIMLSNADMIHDKCLEDAQNELRNLDQQHAVLESQLSQCDTKLSEMNNLINKIISIFKNNEKEIESILGNKQIIIKAITTTKNKIKNQKNRLIPIYDYFLTYPPDWDERREQVITRDGFICQECGDNHNLHLHHLIPLSKGGSNKIENLKLLCSFCHSAKHHHIRFEGEFEHNETIFSKRIKIIQQAIDEEAKIQFKYRKFNESKYHKRTILPSKIFNYESENNNFTLCVRGHCALRNANRTFAMNRMKELKIL